jgi:hypothetical protein
MIDDGHAKFLRQTAVNASLVNLATEANHHFKANSPADLTRRTGAGFLFVL